MNNLDEKELELVAIGASMGSNCIPCVTFHIKKGKELGLTDSQIFQAINMSEKVKNVPASRVRESALNLIDKEISSIMRNGLND